MNKKTTGIGVFSIGGKDYWLQVKNGKRWVGEYGKTMKPFGVFLTSLTKKEMLIWSKANLNDITFKDLDHKKTKIIGMS